MTANQRARRIRQLNSRRDQMASELRRLEAELAPLEREESRSLGFFFGGTLKGKQLLDAMDRRDMKAQAA